MNKTKKENAETEAVEMVTPERVVSGRYPFLSGWFDRLPLFPTTFPDLWSSVTGEGIPVEEYFEDDTLVIRAEVPGVDVDEDIDVEIESGRLSIRARRERREEIEEEGRFRSEFHYGSFRRTMMLPTAIEAEDVQAEYHDGILEVRVPMKDEESATKKVPVSRT